MNPVDLGWYERRPGSGIWSHPDKGDNKYEQRVCQNSDCGEEFMGHRQPGRGRFCSRECRTATLRLNDSGYGPRHERVRRARGSASDLACVDCGQSAAEWSQVHGTTGQDLEHYKPRCKSCHRLYDGPRRGEANGQAKLTEAQVRGIYASVGLTDQELADIYGTDKSNVNKIRRGTSWKHITNGVKAAW